MGTLIVLLIIVGCAAYQYQKGTFAKSVVTIIVTICASAVAFGYFETLANLFINRGDNGSLQSLAPWAQMLSFVLLFVLAFAILRTIADQLMRPPIDLGFLPERIGRVICGIFLGLIVSGLLLTALAMAPLSSKYPYQRFNLRRPDPEYPKRVLFNADGFATGWFSILSRGGLSTFGEKRSFAVLHPAFIDQLFLNRHAAADELSIVTSPDAIEVPNKGAVWPAPERPKDADDPNKTIEPRSGRNLTIVRVGIKRKAIKTAGTFTLSQLRLICKQKTNGDLLAGKAINIYPIGYIKTENQLQRKQLSDRIYLKRADFDDSVKWIDFAFYVPDGFVPALAEFKQNCVISLPPPVPADQAPAPVPFIQPTES